MHNAPDAHTHRSTLAAALQWGSLFLLVLSAVMLPMITASAAQSLRPLTLGLGITAAFFWTIKMIFDQRVVLPSGWLAYAGAAILGVAVISGIRSDCPQAALVTVLTWLGYAAAFLLALWAGSNEHVRSAIGRAICALALPIAVYGALQYAILLDMTRAEIQADKAGALLKTGSSEQDYEALLQRTKSKRVFSTFALPNNLAGFLLILIPPSIALCVSARRGPARAVTGAAVLAMLVGLFLTFSKGGWLAAAAVLLIFLITKGRLWLARRRMILTAAVLGTVIVCAAAIGLSPDLRHRLTAMRGELGGSARVRAEYWSAGLSMWTSHPILGVGPGNFQNHYMQHKSVAAEDVKTAHNDYVQILAECGPFALLAYAAFWLLLLRPSVPLRGFFQLRGREPETQNSKLETQDTPPRGLFTAAGLAGIAAACFLARPLAVPNFAMHAALVCMFLALWGLAYWATGTKTANAQTTATLSTGLMFGLLGFLLHSTVDFDLYVDGVGYAALIVAGLLAAPWAPKKTVPLEGSRQVAVLLAVSAAGLALLFVATAISKADSYRNHALRLIRMSLTEDRSPEEARIIITEAQNALETACRINPIDHEAFALLAEHSEQTGLLTPGREGLKRLEQAAWAWRRAVTLNPSFAEYHAHLARFFARTSVTHHALIQNHLADYKSKAAALSVPTPPLDTFVPAIVESYLATRCAPTRPQYRINYGQILLLAELPREARNQFQAALERNNAMIRGNAPARQWLTEAELKELKQKLGLTGAQTGAIIQK